MALKRNSVGSFLFTLHDTFRKSIGLFVAGLAVFGGFLVFFCTTSITELEQTDSMFLGKDPNYIPMLEQMQYSFWQEENPLMSMMITAVVLIISTLLALSIFRFMSSKKTVNVYYSLGISRSSLFFAKAIVGILMILLLVVIPFLLVAGINIQYFGSSAALWQAVVYFAASYSVIGILAFLVCACVSSLVGNTVEALGFTTALMCAPTALSVLAEYLMNALVFGSEYSLQNIHYASQEPSLVIKLLQYNPILFNLQTVMQLSEQRKAVYMDPGYVIEPPNYQVLLSWAAVALVCFFAALVIFRYRKAEFCGVPGRSTLLNFVTIAAVGVCVVGLCVLYIPLDSLVLRTLIGIGLYLVLYFIAELILKRSGKRALRGFWQVPLHAALGVAMVAIFSGGLFGYSSKLPQLQEIQSVSFNSGSHFVFSDLYAYPERTYENWQTQNKAFSSTETFYYSSMWYLSDSYKDRALIADVYALHEQIIKTGELKESKLSANFNAKTNGVCQPIMLKYTLKDGSTFSRTFLINSTETLEAFALLQYEHVWRKEVDKNFNPVTVAEEDIKTELERRQFSLQSIEKIVLLNRTLDQDKVVSITKEQREGLLAALRKDLQEMDYQEWLFPSTEEYGMLYLYYTEEYARQLVLNKTTYKSIDPAADTNSIPLYACMKNTIAFLKDAGWLQDMQTHSPAVSAKVLYAVKPTEQNNHYGYLGNTTTLSFVGCSLSSLSQKMDNVELFWGDISDLYRFPEVYCTITDKDLAGQLLQKAYTNYYNSRDGYFVDFTLENGTRVLKYVPAADMPQNIREAASKLNAQMDTPITVDAVTTIAAEAN